MTGKLCLDINRLPKQALVTKWKRLVSQEIYAPNVRNCLKNWVLTPQLTRRNYSPAGPTW